MAKREIKYNLRRTLVKLYLVRIGMTSVGLLLLFILLYPLLYVIVSSLIRGQVIASGLSDLARYGLTLDHYISTITDPHFISATITSIVVAALTIVFSVLVITPAAYAFSRFGFKGKDFLLILYLILSQVGGGFGVAAIIALYVFLLKLDSLGVPVIGNPLVLALAYTGGAVPFQTWLIKSYFDALPRSLDEAAFIDGANWRTIVFKVVLPASKPAMTLIALFAFIGAWGEFILASFLRVETLAAYIYETALGQTIYWGDFAARTLLFSIPVIIVYAYAQKYIGEAMTFAATKY
jgi:arabinogalactan oligomer/maltooligosaccharide transport system permease protein